MQLPSKKRPALLIAAICVAMSGQVLAQAPAAGNDAATSAPSTQVVSPEAEAVLNRMTTYLQGLSSFSISADSTRDEVLDYGYKLQNNERATLVVLRPNKLRADISGDVRDRTFVYDGKTLVMYAPDDAAYVSTPAPDTIAELIGTLLDLGVEMPLIDMLYQGTAGTLADAARGGVLVGTTMIDGVPTDHLAFRQASVDWQLWVDQGPRPLPRKIAITTRYAVGDPQYQATMRWDLKPKINASTFKFTPAKGVNQIPLAGADSNTGGAQ